VPEATVDKYRDFMLWQDNIWMTWKIRAMQAKPVAKQMQCFAHSSLRVCIPRPNAGHVPAAVFFRNTVCHGSQV